MGYGLSRNSKTLTAISVAGSFKEDKYLIWVILGLILFSAVFWNKQTKQQNPIFLKDVVKL